MLGEGVALSNVATKLAGTSKIGLFSCPKKFKIVGVPSDFKVPET
jgi:hypothetical protein